MAFGIMNKFVMIILPFINRTVMTQKLGGEYLGLNSLCLSILQVLSLSELGFGSALVFSMYKPLAEDNHEEICALLNLYRKIYKIIAFVMIGFGLCVLPFLHLLIKGKAPQDTNIYLVFLIYLFNSVLSYLLFAYKSSIPNVMQRNDITSNINTLTHGIMQIMQICVIWFLQDYYLCLIIMPAATIVHNLILNYTVKKKYPEYVCRGEVSAEKKKEIKVKVTGLMINKVCQVTRNSLDSICVSAFLGLKLNGMYNNYYYVINALIGFGVVILQSMQAGVGNSIVMDTKEKNYQDMKRLNFLYMWLNGFCTACLLCLYQPFIEQFFGKKMVFGISVAVLFAVYYYALKMGDIRGLYSDGIGLWWENRYRAIAESVANILLNIVLGKLFGVHGIILATLISLVIINFGYGSQIVFTHYFQNGKLKEYFLNHGFYAAVTAVVCAVTYLICTRIRISSLLLTLLMRGVICVIVPNALYFLIYRHTSMYKMSVPWLLERLLRRRKKYPESVS